MTTHVEATTRSRRLWPGRQLSTLPRPVDDLLAGAAWYCAPTPPGTVSHPDALPGNLVWRPARVPGTAASALRDAGMFAVGDQRDFDAEDWWFACRVPASSAGRHVLVLGGLATDADVWLDGRHLLHSSSMFVRHEVPLGNVTAGSRLVLRCAALGPQLQRRGPRARWRTALVEQQGLRNWRTTILGRVPVWPRTGAPVGPWRPVRLEPLVPGRLESSHLAARYDGSAGELELRARLLDGPGAGVPLPGGEALLRCAGHEAAVSLERDGELWRLGAVLRIPGVEPWWPRPHGEPVLHEAELVLGGRVVPLGRVGFRTVDLDRRDGAFRLSCNGVPLFCRGVAWWPADPVSLAAPAEVTRATLAEIASGGFDLVRISGWTCYENEAFFDACDELGLLVWQDLMFGTLDLPPDSEFAALVEREVDEALSPLARHACLALVCGSDEGESQPAMLGLPADQRHLDLVDRLLLAAAERLLPGVPVVTSTPNGGELPFFPGQGSSHYFGVGHHFRPLTDARLADVRFAAECLAFSVPPARTSTELFAGTVHVVRDPRWLAAVPHDPGTSWDFADVTDHYLRELFGLDPVALRAADADRYLSLQRATVATVVERVLAEWRRPGSNCAGALFTFWRDQLLGPGFGLLDSLGVPKASWYAARRALAPLGVLLVDEGLNGLHLHLSNDRPGELDLIVAASRYAEGERLLETAERAVHVPARGSVSLVVDGLFPGFRDLTYAYRFGPPEHDVIGVQVRAGGALLAERAHLPLGLCRATEADLGLEASLRRAAEGWELQVDTRRFAQLVELDVAGWRCEDSFFDVLPGSSRRVLLRPAEGTDGASGAAPRVLVRPLNGAIPVRAAAER